MTVAVVFFGDFVTVCWCCLRRLVCHAQEAWLARFLAGLRPLGGSELLLATRGRGSGEAGRATGDEGEGCVALAAGEGLSFGGMSRKRGRVTENRTGERGRCGLASCPEYRCCTKPHRPWGGAFRGVFLDL